MSEKQRKNRTAKERQMLYNIQEKRTRDFFLVIFILFGFDRLNTHRIQEAEIIHVFFHCIVYVMAQHQVDQTYSAGGLSTMSVEGQDS